MNNLTGEQAQRLVDTIPALLEQLQGWEAGGLDDFGRVGVLTVIRRWYLAACEESDDGSNQELRGA